jgi:hypothetical protein
VNLLHCKVRYTCYTTPNVVLLSVSAGQPFVAYKAKFIEAGITGSDLRRITDRRLQKVGLRWWYLCVVLLAGVSKTGSSGIGCFVRSYYPSLNDL